MRKDRKVDKNLESLVNELKMKKRSTRTKKKKSLFIKTTKFIYLSRIRD